MMNEYLHEIPDTSSLPPADKSHVRIVPESTDRAIIARKQTQFFRDEKDVGRRVSAWGRSSLCFHNRCPAA
jgi:hypothetical protein